jgi:hypothetical protein
MSCLIASLACVIKAVNSKQPSKGLANISIFQLLICPCGQSSGAIHWRSGHISPSWLFPVEISFQY